MNFGITDFLVVAQGIIAESPQSCLFGRDEDLQQIARRSWSLRKLGCAQKKIGSHCCRPIWLYFFKN
jgi:hypothetical protein